MRVQETKELIHVGGGGGTKELIYACAGDQGINTCVCRGPKN